MTPPITINPDAIYTEGSASLTLGISLTAIGRARRDGTLPFVRRGNRILILGRHLLDWVTPRQPHSHDHTSNRAGIACAVPQEMEVARG